MKKNQIIIGTSAWGSRISFKHSLNIGTCLIEMGIKEFDTAPHYGSGYSHHILNILAKVNKIEVNTKYGDSLSPNIKEILKRIYRYNDLKSFKNSFKYLEFSKIKRFKKSFWDLKNIEENLDLYLKDLNKCRVKTLFLHSPPKDILNKTYLELVNSYLIKRNIKFGISWPNHSDYEFLLSEFPNLILQISLNYFLKNQKKIVENFKFVYINSIFKNSIDLKKNKSTKTSLKNYLHDIEIPDNYKIIIGINSKKSVEKISQII